MMIRFSIWISILMTGTPVMSQSLPDITHDGSSISFMLNGHDMDGGGTFSENYTYQLVASSRYTLPHNFGLSVSLGFNEEVSEGAFYSNRTFIDFNPFYKFNDGEIGLFYTAITHEDADQSGGDSQIGVTGLQQFESFVFEAYASTYKEATGDESNNVGIALGYSLSDNLFGYFAERADYDNDQFEGTSTLGLRYDVDSSPITLTAEITRFIDQDTSLFASSWNQISVGATYNFAAGANSMFRGIRSVDFFYD